MHTLQEPTNNGWECEASKNNRTAKIRIPKTPTPENLASFLRLEKDGVKYGNHSQLAAVFQRLTCFKYHRNRRIPN